MGAHAAVAGLVGFSPGNVKNAKAIKAVKKSPAAWRRQTSPRINRPFFRHIRADSTVYATPIKGRDLFAVLLFGQPTLREAQENTL